MSDKRRKRKLIAYMPQGLWTKFIITVVRVKGKVGGGVISESINEAVKLWLKGTRRRGKIASKLSLLSISRGMGAIRFSLQAHTRFQPL